MNGLESTLLFQLVNGIIYGCILALVALGLTLIFGEMGVVNMAHGEFYMVGAVGLFILVPHLPSFWLSVVIIGAAMMPVGWALERLVLRPFEGRAMPSMVATIGLSFILQQLALIFFGGTSVQVAAPISSSVRFGGIAIQGYWIAVAAISVVLIGLVWLMLYRTSLGMKIRASMQDAETANAMGINTGRISMLTFGLGMGLAGVGGALSAPISQVYYLMGADVVLFAFIVVIIGGLGSLKGALVAAVGLSVIQSLLSVPMSPTLARCAIFGIMTVVLIVRPSGLFGRA